MPVYAKEITPQGPFKNGPGEIDRPIAVDGKVVFHGDSFVGDIDGIVVIRAQDAAGAARAARAKKAKEDKSFETMKRSTEEYAQKHIASTASCMEGKGAEFIRNSNLGDYK